MEEAPVMKKPAAKATEKSLTHSMSLAPWLAGKDPVNGGVDQKIIFGWWFGTFFLCPYVGNNHPTNQILMRMFFRCHVWLESDGSLCSLLFDGLSVSQLTWQWKGWEDKNPPTPAVAHLVRHLPKRRPRCGGKLLKTRCCYKLPSAYLTVCHGKSPFLIGKPSINGPCSMAMLNNQRVVSRKVLWYQNVSMVDVDIWWLYTLVHWMH